MSDLKIMPHGASNAEWYTVKDELLDAGQSPTAFDVSEEQRRRAAGRGERPPTYEEIVAEYERNGGF